MMVKATTGFKMTRVINGTTLLMDTHTSLMEMSALTIGSILMAMLSILNGATLASGGDPTLMSQCNAT